MALNIAELKEKWVGVEFDTREFEVLRDRALEWAAACGETDPRFTDPNHPDFQAHPSFTTQFRSTMRFPEGFPARRGFDAGKCVECLAPVRPGDRLTATSVIADIYEKTGRSGAMAFIVHRMRFVNQNGEPVSVVDSRLLQQQAQRAQRENTGE